MGECAPTCLSPVTPWSCPLTEYLVVGPFATPDSDGPIRALNVELGVLLSGVAYLSGKATFSHASCVFYVDDKPTCERTASR